MRNPFPIIGAVVLAFALLAGSNAPNLRVCGPAYFRPTVYRSLAPIPTELRERNYAGGSCVHATTVTLLRWVGMHAKADQWRSKYSGGESSGPHTRKLSAEGLTFAMTNDGDERLLDWALETRRGCGVTWPERHVVALVGKQNGEAVIIDNNRPGDYRRVPWDSFIRKWRQCGGWAFAIVAAPPAPIPRT